MFSEMSVLHEWMEDGQGSPYREPVDERSRRYHREIKEGLTTLPYEEWVIKVWMPENVKK
jgi:hypothetical protein